MNYIRKNNVSLSSIVYILMVLSTLYLSDVAILKGIGQVCIYSNIIFVILNIFIDIAKLKKINKYIYKLYIIIYLFFIYMLINMLINTNQNIEDSFFKSILLIFILILPISMSKLNFNNNFYNTVFILNILYLIYLISSIIKDGVSSIGFMSYTSNPNALAMVVYIFIVFMSLIVLNNNNMVYKICLLSMIYILLFTKSRTTILAFIFSVTIYFLLCKFKKIKFRSIFLIGSVLYLVFTLFYINLPNTKLGDFLNQISLDIFDKSLFSGRNLIWSEAIDLIKDKFVFGYGIKGGNYYIMSSQRGFHNFYIEITMKLGIIGLLFIFIYLYNIFKIIDIHKDEKIVILMSSYFLGVLIIQMFESTMGLSGMGVGLFQWFIIAIPINYILYKYK